MSKKGHHGGAWKVAYADFVTAMMALFLVLWLVNQDQKIREAIERTFKQPWNPIESVGSRDIAPLTQEPAKGSSGDGTGSKSKDSRSSVVNLEAMLKQLQAALERSQTDDTEKPVEVRLENDGIKISIFDRARRPVFEPQSAEFTPYGDTILYNLAWPVASYTNFSIEIEGHTEAGRPPIRENYSNWELSSDRANAARRKLLEYGVRHGQLRSVSGFADTQPLEEIPPTDESNRRVTVMLRVQNPSKPG
jgi:chemotaxis protein MotB